MIHDEPYPVYDDDPILWAAFKRAGMQFDPVKGWHRPEEMPSDWRTPADAQRWAVERGACSNRFEASNSWLKIVKQLGSFGRHNRDTAFQAFFDRQCEKLQAA